MSEMVLRHDATLGVCDSFGAVDDKPDDRTGEGVIGPYVRPQSSPSVPVWRACIDGIPMKAVLERQEGEWLASLDLLQVYGSGRSFEDAIDDLLFHLENVCESFLETPDEDLTEAAQRVKSLAGRIQRR